MVRAKKRFGQHFLEPVWAGKVLGAIAPGAGDSFLEIGPGRGALTRPLVEAAGRVLAVEIDRDLAAALAAERLDGLTVVEADFLELSSADLAGQFRAARLGEPVRVAGNLPYNAAGPILFALRDHYAAGLPLGDATVMVQREVADRLTARPGTKDYGALTVLLGYRAGIRRVLDLPPGAFRPAPKVRSSVVGVTFHAAVPAPEDEPGFDRVVKGLFSRRRKTLHNGLRGLGATPQQAAAVLARAGLDGGRRAETCAIEELVGLANAWRAVL